MVAELQPLLVHDRGPRRRARHPRVQHCAGRATCPVGAHLPRIARNRSVQDANHFLWQGAAGRGLQRYLLLVAESARCHGPERQLVTRCLESCRRRGRRFCFAMLRLQHCWLQGSNDTRVWLAVVTFLAYSLPQCVPLSMPRRFRHQAKMRSSFDRFTRAIAIAAMLGLPSQAFAQSDDPDPEIRIQQLENQLRQLTGQNEDLQYRNRQLEERLRALGVGVQAAPGAQATMVQPGMTQPGMVQPGMVQPGMVQPGIAAASPVQPAPVYRPPGYEPPQI